MTYTRASEASSRSHCSCRLSGAATDSVCPTRGLCHTLQRVVRHCSVRCCWAATPSHDGPADFQRGFKSTACLPAMASVRSTAGDSGPSPSSGSGYTSFVGEPWTDAGESHARPPKLLLSCIGDWFSCASGISSKVDASERGATNANSLDYSTCHFHDDCHTPSDLVTAYCTPPGPAAGAVW